MSAQELALNLEEVSFEDQRAARLRDLLSKELLDVVENCCITRPQVCLFLATDSRQRGNWPAPICAAIFAASS